MNPDKISKFIFQLRTEKGLSQYQLADMIPISRQAVSKWETGKTIPDSSTLIRLSEIFQVSINELLKGERLENNSIKELESTTLSIIDENNKKKETIKKVLKAYFSSILFLLLIFLIYYYINTHNSIKVYTINGKSEHFDLYEGMFITTKQKTYIKLGKINKPDDIEIKGIDVYYQDKNEKVFIFSDNDLNKTVRNMYGYEEYFKQSDISKILKKSIIEITYNDNQKETLKLKYERDFISTWNLFIKKSDKEKETNNKEKQQINIEQMAINKIKKQGELIDEMFVLLIKEDNTNIEISYHESLNQLLLKKSGELEWSLIPNDYYYCKIMNDTKKCKQLIENDLYKYLLKNR